MRNSIITFLLILLGFIKLNGQNISMNRSSSDSTAFEVINKLMDLLKKDTMRTLVIDSSQWNILLDKKYYAKKYNSIHNFEQKFFPLFDSLLVSSQDDLGIIKLFGFTFDKLFGLGVDLNIDEKISKDNSQRHLLGSKYDFEKRKLYIFEQIIERYIRYTKHIDGRNADYYRKEIENFVKYSNLGYPYSVYYQLLNGVK